jgi:hypothetical protein
MAMCNSFAWVCQLEYRQTFLSGFRREKQARTTGRRRRKTGESGAGWVRAPGRGSLHIGRKLRRGPRGPSEGGLRGLGLPLLFRKTRSFRAPQRALRPGRRAQCLRKRSRFIPSKLTGLYALEAQRCTHNPRSALPMLLSALAFPLAQSNLRCANRCHRQHRKAHSGEGWLSG